MAEDDKQVVISSVDDVVVLQLRQVGELGGGKLWDISQPWCPLIYSACFHILLFLWSNWDLPLPHSCVVGLPDAEGLVGIGVLYTGEPPPATTNAKILKRCKKCEEVSKLTDAHDHDQDGFSTWVKKNDNKNLGQCKCDHILSFLCLHTPVLQKKLFNMNF